ncbi:MAG: Rrf2 family transcriptional regulator [Planctomycetia bacterium]|nr:Rrf2 family transcriptional regulator [Planctomycetia bacterium]
MRISTKGRYGLRILLDLALHVESRPRMLRDIAESQGISEKYLSRLIVDLRQANLVSSVRGAKGGYSLARNPAEISILEVVEVMEGSLAVVDCVDCDEPQPCMRAACCATREMWNGMNEKIRAILKEVTLQSILDRQREMDADAQCWNYCI